MASLAAGHILADDKPAVAPGDASPFQPSTLFLTWQRDPTTTMTVQWVGVRGETADTHRLRSCSAHAARRLADAGNRRPGPTR